MIYIGFGFLLCFIHKLQLTCLTMFFWVSALSLQYYFLWRTFWEGVMESHFEDVTITPNKLIAAEA